jgi:hypothetical protein
MIREEGVLLRDPQFMTPLQREASSPGRDGMTE